MASSKAPRAWYAKMESYLLSQNFVRFKSDLNVYMLRMTDSLLLLVLYVDDLLITGCSTSMIFVVKRILHDMFLMTDMGLLHFFLGLKINGMHQASNCLRPSMHEISLRDFT
jgi:hypothetical protein